ncbi:31919765-7676-4837-8424-c4e9f33ae9e5 [Thermothielavioides terrestris]|uniref:Uncharacterized protein n=2 Tax=Thermothielavioides terrestris TaxID=2587410 RepID=G2QWX6_THETT|nr:uncharacterized protein THITE_2085446 [Thermothielavioides terrestris NRRL 8126]AEO63942.1 hypothetical protein THITE_2085446 [Thermothielavioides terrestris NRRL 8126]SPQ23323.1 31919765-7676-4837-8424-c4e9f33ae9e5 [Thermothielavioides terrestris]
MKVARYQVVFAGFFFFYLNVKPNPPAAATPNSPSYLSQPDITIPISRSSSIPIDNTLPSGTNLIPPTQAVNRLGFHGMVRDSLARLTADPLRVGLHLNAGRPVAHPRQFVPWLAGQWEDASFWFGGTALCEVDSGSGGRGRGQL